MREKSWNVRNVELVDEPQPVAQFIGRSMYGRRCGNVIYKKKLER